MHAIFLEWKNVEEQAPQVYSMIHLISHIFWRHTLILIESSCQVIAITFALFLQTLNAGERDRTSFKFQLLGKREVCLMAILQERRQRKWASNPILDCYQLPLMLLYARHLLFMFVCLAKMKYYETSFRHHLLLL